MAQAVGRSLLTSYSRLVVLPHSVFALPFALAGLLLASRGEPGDIAVQKTGVMFLWVLVAVVAARTAAMGFNRVVDMTIDAQNPRTKMRELPRGVLSRGAVIGLVVGSSAVFLAAAAMLGMRCFVLAPAVLLVLFGYSFTKRFTSFSHLVLGFALSLAPGGAWWVVRPELSITPILLMFAVMMWVAGFDILYSCQDVSFDRENRLYSIPARFEIGMALRISRAIHILAFLGFLAVGLSAELSGMYFIGVGALSLFLFGQHLIISEKHLKRINHAFFTFNGIISLCYLLLIFIVV